MTALGLKRLVFGLTFSLLLLTSCSERVRLNRNFTKFVHTEVILPKTMEVYDNHTLNMVVLDNLKPFKLIIYYDSLDCVSCKMTLLYELEELYEYSVNDKRFSMMPVFSPKENEIEEVRTRLMSENLPFPVYVDTHKDFSNLNKKIPAEEKMHYFLINSVGKPVFVGNPMWSENLKTLFEKKLNENIMQ